MPKLTLSTEKDVIETAKLLADQRGTSVSAMFSQFIKAVSGAGRSRRTVAPITRRLRGLAKVSSKKTDRELFEAAILAKGRR